MNMDNLDDSIVSFISRVLAKTNAPVKLSNQNKFLHRSMRQIDSLNTHYLRFVRNITSDNFIDDADVQMYKKIKKDGHIPSDRESVDGFLSLYFENDEDLIPSRNDIICWEDRLQYMKESSEAIDQIITSIEEEINNFKEPYKIAEKKSVNDFPLIAEINTIQNDAMKKIEITSNGIRDTINTVISNDFNCSRIQDSILSFVLNVNSVLSKVFIRNNVDEKNKETDQVHCRSENISDLLLVSDSLKKHVYNKEVISMKKQRTLKCIEETKHLSNNICCNKFIPSIAEFRSRTERNYKRISEREYLRRDLSKYVEHYCGDCNVINIIVKSNAAKKINQVKYYSDMLNKLLDASMHCIGLNMILTCASHTQIGQLISASKSLVDLNMFLDNKFYQHCSRMSKMELMKNGYENAEKNEREKIDKLYNLSRGVINSCLCSTAENDSIVTPYQLKNTINDIQDSIFDHCVFAKINCSRMLISDVKNMQKIIFNGPMQQLTMIDNTLLGKTNTLEKKLLSFQELHSEFKNEYLQKMVQLKSDEQFRVIRTLWISFLNDPEKLKMLYETIKRKVNKKREL